jgi:tyrosyl-tRNA synthetase
VPLLSLFVSELITPVFSREFRVSTMLSRDSVKNRMSGGEDGGGISLAEFCYQALQAFDFWELFQSRGAADVRLASPWSGVHTSTKHPALQKRKSLKPVGLWLSRGCRALTLSHCSGHASSLPYSPGVKLQIGGSDQWGNIVAGVDLIRRLDKRLGGPEGVHAGPHGLTLPLLTDKAGRKFGKTAGNAVWLTAEHTTAFDLYQFLVRVDDSEVEQLLLGLTFLEVDEVLAWVYYYYYC